MSSIKKLKISDYNRICRLCLKIGSNLNKLIPFNPENLNNVLTVTTVEIDANENLPKNICSNCNQKIYSFIQYRKNCLNNDEILKLHYQIQLDDTEGNLENIIKNEIKVEHNDSDDQINNVQILEENKTAIKNDHIYGTTLPLKAELKQEFTVRKSQRVRKLDKFIKALKNYNASTDDEEELYDNERDGILLWKSNGKRKRQRSHDISFDTPTVKCNLCDNIVKSSLMEYHINEHNQYFPFNCNECDKTYSSPLKLQRHKTLVHKFMNGLICNDCGITVKNTQNLIRHKQVVHLKKFMSRCSTCSLVFSTREALKRHLMVHENQKPFVCNVCDATFRTSSNLKTHLRVHTNEKPFKCEICDAEFSYNLALKKHVQQHVEDNNINQYLF